MAALKINYLFHAHAVISLELVPGAIKASKESESAWLRK